ncbi:MAG TPA: hypothetical protein VHQ65_06580 [Thermoanaerobaculia bacterium]|nr:hypothetical protein [Thermoanaerobaculia bacterium]
MMNGRKGWLAAGALMILLVGSQVEAACELCGGSFGNRSCRLDANNGYSDCSNDYFGNCINGTVACGSCSADPMCTDEENQTNLDGRPAAGGEVLLEVPRACETGELIIEA